MCFASVGTPDDGVQTACRAGWVAVHDDHGSHVRNTRARTLCQLAPAPAESKPWRLGGGRGAVDPRDSWSLGPPRADAEAAEGRAAPSVTYIRTGRGPLGSSSVQEGSNWNRWVT